MSTVDLETLNASTKAATLPLSSLEAERPEDSTMHQHLWKGMENIWEQVSRLPEGQNQVVMSQLWEFGKSSPTPTPKKLPALAAHGFIIEQLEDGQTAWKPYSPYLKDFWRVAIHVSPSYGYRLLPHRAFQANLRAAMQMTLC